MANYPAWSKLNAAQRKMALDRWHQRNQAANAPADTGGTPAGVAPAMPFFEQLYNTLVGGFAPIGKGPLGQRASIETQLQYGPTLQALVQLGQQASQQKQADIRGITRGGLAAAQGIGNVSENFNGLVSASPAPTGEAAGRLGLTRDAVSGALARMQGQQYAGINAGVQRAKGQYRQARQDIVGKMLQEAQKGALYNQGQFAGYAGDAAKAREARTQWEAEQRNALIRAGINPTTGQYDPALNKPAGWKDPGDHYGYTNRQWAGLSPEEKRAAAKAWNTDTKAPSDSDGNGLTPAQKRDRREHYATIRDSIETIKKDGHRLGSVKVHYNPETGAILKPDKTGAYPDGTETRRLTEPEIQAAIDKKYPKAPPIVKRAAAEMAIDGTMSLRTLRALKRRFPHIEMPHDWVDRTRGTDAVPGVGPALG